MLQKSQPDGPFKNLGEKFRKISEKRTKIRKNFRFLEKIFEKRTKFSEFLPKFAKCSFFEQKEHYTASPNFR